MADAPRAPELPDLPEAVAAPRRRWAPQLIWIIPIVAVLAGGWLAVKAILERGPTITISFKTGEGLEAGKTKIKYRDVDIGLVKEIALSDDRKRVVATAELEKGAADLLVEDTRFWAVRPRITAGGVSGLGTLLSGPYIAVDPGHGKRARRDFVALDVPPIVTHEDPGREFILRAEDLGSHEVGVPVYFRRLQVGEVVTRELDKDGKGVSIKIFVRAPFDQYVTTHTRFWNASGVDVSLDATGVRMQTESLVSILIGGIAFQAPPDGAGVAPAADANAVFNLFPTREAAMKQPDLEILPLVLVFRQSVRGLSVGAPVDFRGVTIGEVVRIGAEFDPKAFNFVQPVEINLYPDRLRAHSRDSGTLLPPSATQEERLKRVQLFVDKGFRAQLRTGNLLTGQAYIAVDFFPDTPKVKFDPSKRPLEIPTIPGAFEELEATIASVVKKLDRVQYEQIGADLRKVMATLDQTLKSADVLAKRLGDDTTPELNRTLEDARRTLKSAEGALATESPLQTDLRETLRELTRAAASLRALTDYLERQPQSLIRGKPAEEPN
ncbi:MAG TPA: MlaD family protein [Burkholderiales bacterium]|nr:MlaD family protein [Burkholderiales bacterium]